MIGHGLLNEIILQRDDGEVNIAYTTRECRLECPFVDSVNKLLKFLVLE